MTAFKAHVEYKDPDNDALNQFECTSPSWLDLMEELRNFKHYRVISVTIKSIEE